MSDYSLSACEQIVEMDAAATKGWKESKAHIFIEGVMKLLIVFIDKRNETQLSRGEISLFPEHNLKTSLIPTIHVL